MTTKNAIKDAIAVLANPAKGKRKKAHGTKTRPRNARGQFIKARKNPEKKARKNPLAESVILATASNPKKPRAAARRAKRNPVTSGYTPLMIGAAAVALIYMLAAAASQFRARVSEKLREYPNVTALAVAAPLTAGLWYYLKRDKKHATTAAAILTAGGGAAAAILAVGAYRRWIAPRLEQYATAPVGQTHGAQPALTAESNLANMRDYRESVKELAEANGLRMVEAAGLRMVEAATCMEPVGSDYETEGAYRPLSVAEARGLLGVREA